MSNLFVSLHPKLLKMKEKVGLLPKRLFNYRKRKKYNQTDVAKAIGISTDMYSKIELGKRMMQDEYLPQIAKLLEIDITDLRVMYLADKIEAEVDRFPSNIAGKALNIIQDKYASLRNE